MWPFKCHKEQGRKQEPPAEAASQASPSPRPNAGGDAKMPTPKQAENQESPPGAATQVRPPPAPTGGNDPKGVVPESQVLTSLEGVALPKSVIVTEQLSLLNEAGQEARVPIGSVIRVVKRSDKGTLTMTIDGASFVGHESRLAGKAKWR